MDSKKKKKLAQQALALSQVKPLKAAYIQVWPSLRSFNFHNSHCSISSYFCPTSQQWQQQL
jgi:hypothetical protein